MSNLYLIVFCFVLMACEMPTQAPQKVEANLSIPSTTTAPTTAAPTIVTKAAPTADITPQQVREIFEQDVLKRLLAQQEGRQLHVDNPNLQEGLKVIVADINGNGQPEGIVQYQLLAGAAEAAGMPVIEGIYIYPSKDGQLQPTQMTRVDLPTAPAYIQQIEGKVWRFKTFAYAEGDPSCCPSVIAEKNYQLTDLYAWEKVN